MSRQIYHAQSHLPPSQLKSADMDLIIAKQAIQQATRAENNMKKSETMFNRSVARSKVKIGNWVEEQAYWDGLEDRDGEYYNASTIIMDPTVNPADHFKSANREYGTQIDYQTIELDKKHARKTKSFYDTEKLVSQKKTHNFINDQCSYQEFKNESGRDHTNQEIQKCNFNYSVKCHAPQVK